MSTGAVSPTPSLQRFGFALVPWGKLDLKRKEFTRDFRPIDADCPCMACRRYTRAYLQPLLLRKETVACNLITIHNLTYHVRGWGSGCGLDCWYTTVIHNVCTTHTVLPDAQSP